MEQEYKLTRAQKHLLHGLKLFGLTIDEAVGVMLALETPEQEDKLMFWMAENKTATPSDIIGKTMDITRMTERRGDML